MTKHEFLEELSKRIDMLEDAEQQDILTEYAQHIDFRVHSGLSEEEAIKDFGDFDQLVTEILGAYHVKPDFQEMYASSTLSGHPVTERCNTGYTFLKGKLKAAGMSIKRFFACIGSWLHQWFYTVTQKLKGCFSRKGKAIVQRRTQTVQQMSGCNNKTCKSAMQQAWHGSGRICMMMLRLLWNLLLLVCGAPILLITMMMVLWMGVSVMLLFQGYPFFGITLCTLGVLLFCTGLLGLGWTMIWHRSGEEDMFYEQTK